MKQCRKIALGVLLTIVTGFASAEDIDLFVAAPPATSGDAPNVLLFIDNTANWSTAFEAEKAALVATFANLPEDKFNVGIMFYGQPDLGYLRAHIRPMDATNRPLYQALVDGLDEGDDKASARTLARTMSEIYRYFDGDETVEPSSNPFDFDENGMRDYSGNSSAPASTKAVHDLGDNPLSGQTDYTYTSPLDPNSCGGTYIIYLGNTTAQGNVTKDNSSRNRDAGDELGDAGGTTTQIPLTNSQMQDNFADEWARFLHQDKGVVVYTIDVDPTPHPEYDEGSGLGDNSGKPNGVGNSDLLRSMAEVSNGKYYRVFSDDGGAALEDLFGGIFDEIQAVNSVFASVALPASTTGQSVFLNQVFIGLFRPDAGALPKWPGNLKQYQLGKTGNNITLRDSLDASAINGNTGFITNCAVSHWTSGQDDGYWSFSPSDDEISCDDSENDNWQDGPNVEKGGQAYVLRATSGRTMKTCSSTHTGCTSLTEFGTGNGDVTAVLTTATINWALGTNVDNVGSKGATVKRPYVHGDVIHSRPVALNYGSDISPQVVVYYGANDGALRAINGNKVGGADIASKGPGTEIWSFMPPEFWGELDRLRTNTDTVKFPATGPSAGASGSLKAYGMDGIITAYEGTVNSVNDKRYIYATMRRGGRSVYAFDVTTVGTPMLAWKRGCQGNVCTPDEANGESWADIGMTWSPATVTEIAGHSNPVIMMGGGYDDCEDIDLGTSMANHGCTSTDLGNNVYVIDAGTGALLKSLPTDRPVPGGVTIVPVSDGDSNMTYAYAADTGGNVYRISGPLSSGVATPIGSNLPSTWHIEKIASFGCGATAAAGCTANRKFMFGPDVVRPNNTTGQYRILVGSGDREKPLYSYSSTFGMQNYFFSFLDKPGVAGWMDDVGNACGANVLCRARLDLVSSVSETAPTLSSDYGYYLQLAAGEQVVTSALVLDNTANFSTHIPVTPVAGACESDLGTATTYNVDFEDADGKTINIVTGGLPPSPVGGIVLIDGKEEPFCIGCGGEGSPIGGSSTGSGSNLDAPKGRVYWKIQE